MVTCTDGEWLRAMQFITSKGRCSVIYGMLDGIPVISRSKGGILAGFLASSKKHPQWEFMMTSAEGIWRHDLMPKIPKENDVYSDYYGARNLPGTSFNDRALIANSNSMYISNVTIQAGAHIDGIQFTYRDARNGQHDKSKTQHHGGFGGTHYSFELGEGEYIVSVSGKYNEKYLTQLCFGTNLGRMSDVYGGGAGNTFSARAPLGDVERYLRLQYILGKSDHVGLNGVIFVWTPDFH
ncbi:Jacalin-like lectin domain-containing protein [Rhizoctonia solani]|nr:Jacalin-like lectin domain-containing protein [Rhizoctonia solani]